MFDLIGTIKKKIFEGDLGVSLFRRTGPDGLISRRCAWTESYFAEITS